MSMTKAEKAEMEALRTARDLARSLRWPEYAEPSLMTGDDIEAAPKVAVLPHDGSLRSGTIEVAEGWFMNEHNQQITKGYSTTTRHCRDARYTSWSRDMGRMYRSRLDALRAMRIIITKHHAADLAALDALIASEPE